MSDHRAITRRSCPSVSVDPDAVNRAVVSTDDRWLYGPLVPPVGGVSKIGRIPRLSIKGSERTGETIDEGKCLEIPAKL